MSHQFAVLPSKVEYIHFHSWYRAGPCDLHWLMSLNWQCSSSESGPWGITCFHFPNMNFCHHHENMSHVFLMGTQVVQEGYETYLQIWNQATKLTNSQMSYRCVGWIKCWFISLILGWFIIQHYCSCAILAINLKKN